jgi:hypothetical protein
VPADHSFRSDHDQRLLPSRPDSPRNYPEEPVEGAEARPRMMPFENSQLLAECQVFKKEIAMSTKEAN